ncbi:MAG: HNH endonuclease signature motif containing protein [Desulfomicrobium apsheronum]|nr:HNH endonuclease signature motif containing protein [Desulfomicrobium apsheronum]
MPLISSIYSNIASVKPKRSKKKGKGKKQKKKSVLQTMPYKAYLKTEYWKKVREAKFAQAGKQCQICGCTDGLEVHHRHYKFRGRELHHLDCLMVLCRKHHQLVHDAA